MRAMEIQQVTWKTYTEGSPWTLLSLVTHGTNGKVCNAISGISFSPSFGLLKKLQARVIISWPFVNTVPLTLGIVVLVF